MQLNIIRRTLEQYKNNTSSVRDNDTRSTKRSTHTYLDTVDTSINKMKIYPYQETQKTVLRYYTSYNTVIIFVTNQMYFVYFGDG